MDTEKPITILKGVNGQLKLYEDRVVITRKGFISKLTQGFFKGDKTIYIHQITSIQIKKGGILTNGYIQFSLGGGVESKRGIVDATKDENTVMFNYRHNDLVAKIKKYVENVMQKQRESVQKTSQIPSVADEIRKLKSLVEAGIITQEEFEAQKEKLLS